MLLPNGWFYICITTLMLFAGCKGPGLFGNKNPHEYYAEKLRSSGLADHAIGKAWLEAANKSLVQPLTITLPYKESGYFSAAEVRAVCYRFSVKRGQEVSISIKTRGVSGGILFTELFVPADDGTDPRFAGMPDSNGVLTYEVDGSGELFLRLQPELLVSISYELTITIGPSLAFPVSGGEASDIGSIWGDDRDAGARRHEGIDIFGKKRTPLIAVADGTIHRVGETKLGGKVLWLRLKGKSISVYYAHLDEQLAQNGQEVKAGDTIGLMGNTGNARTTPPHLHFGIYSSGAIDPLPFVKPVITKLPAMKGDISLLGTHARTRGKTRLKVGERTMDIAANAFITIYGTSGANYTVSLPDGKQGFLPVDAVSNLTSIGKANIAAGTLLLDQPDGNSAIIHGVSSSIAADILAVHGSYQLVSTGSIKGWVSK